MSRRTRIILVIIGLALVGISLAALSYALAPVGTLREATPLAPTLFTLPPAGLP